MNYPQNASTMTRWERNPSTRTEMLFPCPSFSRLSRWFCSRRLRNCSFQQAAFVWYTLNVAILLALPFLLRRRLGLSPKTLALTLIAPLFFLPAILALIQGQPAILMLLLFALAYVDLGSGWELRAGCWLGLASFKPQFVLPMLLALIVWRKKKTLVAFVLTCAGLIAVSIPMVGWRATFGYPRALMQYAGMAGQLGGEHPASMPNLRGFCTRS